MKPFLQSCPRRGGPILKDENVPGAVQGEGSYHCLGARWENCAGFVGVMAWGSGMGLPYGRAVRRGCRYQTGYQERKGHKTVRKNLLGQSWVGMRVGWGEERSDSCTSPCKWPILALTALSPFSLSVLPPVSDKSHLCPPIREAVSLPFRLSWCLSALLRLPTSILRLLSLALLRLCWLSPPWTLLPHLPLPLSPLSPSTRPSPHPCSHSEAPPGLPLSEASSFRALFPLLGARRASQTASALWAVVVMAWGLIQWGEGLSQPEAEALLWRGVWEESSETSTSGLP